MIGACRTRAYLTRAYLSSFDRPALADALSGADLTGAKNLTQNQLDGACGDDKTKLDLPLTIKPCPPDWPATGGSK